MFDDGIKNIPEGIEKVQKSNNIQDFHQAIGYICDYLLRRKYDVKYIHEVEGRAYFLPNEYSERDTKLRLEEAKRKVIDYINNSMSKDDNIGNLYMILSNFHLYLEGMFENEPHKKCTFKQEDLQRLIVQNEYDLQYILYAYLRPLYPAIRAEVSEDMGYDGPVRPDFLISSECAIEVKYTRSSMTIKKLKEEIAADITNYNEKEIYFFIYDKEKIIDNPEAFQEAYERKGIDKDIHIIIQRPKKL